MQVKHRYTQQVMVMKEMRHASKEAKLSFLKEVRFPCIMYVTLANSLHRFRCSRLLIIQIFYNLLVFCTERAKS